MRWTLCKKRLVETSTLTLLTNQQLKLKDTTMTYQKMLDELNFIALDILNTHFKVDESSNSLTETMPMSVEHIKFQAHGCISKSNHKKFDSRFNQYLAQFELLETLQNDKSLRAVEAFRTGFKRPEGFCSYSLVVWIEGQEDSETTPMFARSETDAREFAEKLARRLYKDKKYTARVCPSSILILKKGA